MENRIPVYQDDPDTYRKIYVLIRSVRMEAKIRQY